MRTTIHILADDSDKLSRLRVLLEKRFTVTGMTLRRAAGGGPYDAIVVAADLRAAGNIAILKQHQSCIASSRKRIFVMERNERLLVLQAYALGATGILFAPVAQQDFVRILTNGVAGSGERSCTSAVQATLDGAEAMASMFTAVLAGRPIDVAAVTSAAGKIAEGVVASGLSAWLEAVRQHHEGTYQHCLLVMGVVVDFGRKLGLAEADMRRLYSAAMFHDIGKAAIPAAILNKPGKLDLDERRIMETHPAAGCDYLAAVGGASHEVLDAVRHHHEYLDGSGYPDGLAGSAISDVVRIVTISDIFAALIERRSYKPPLSRQQALDILQGMSGKVEMPLVRAFRDVALPC
ncbi:MAG TPA: HD domain-containing phosphohydrolase [Afipia sp.]